MRHIICQHAISYKREEYLHKDSHEQNDQLSDAGSLISTLWKIFFLDLLKTFSKVIIMKLRIKKLLLAEIVLVIVTYFVVVIAQDLGPDDVYTFCGKGRVVGDNSACFGLCEPNNTSACSPETGICSCTSPPSRLKISTSNFNCKPSRPRTRCHNACKTYTMITPRFRRGETKVCESKTENKRMCFCFSK